MANICKSTVKRQLRSLFYLVSAAIVLALLLFQTVRSPQVGAAAPSSVYVDGASGQDTDSCGGAGAPCQTIAYALSNRAASADTIRVAQGVYVENLTVDKTITLEGGYEATGWSRDIDRYETIIDGTNSRTNMGDWDGRGIQSSAVITADGEYKMWYRGIDLTSTGFGLATSLDGTTWTKYAGNPVLQITEEWEERGFNHPHVIIDGAVYKMWYSIGDFEIGYATSSDGIIWTKYADNPIMGGTPGAWDADGVSAPFVIKVGSSDYRMWYQDHHYSKIGYATSPDGLVWTKHLGPVLTQGPRGTWDDERVNDPNVFLIGTNYHIWYGGNDDGNVRIGHAVSPDGINWAKSAENPILAAGPAGAWDDTSVAEPNVLLDGGLYHMWYSGWQNSWNNAERGYATSPDGLNWTKYAGNPVLSPGETGSWGKPVVRFASGSDDSVISGFTVRNGDAENGGGVYIVGTAVNVISCKVMGNSAFDDGGGIHVRDGATVIISDTQVLNNEAVGDGGGIAIRYDASAELRNNEIARNRSLDYSGGILVNNDATASIVDNQIYANSAATAGGGIVIANGAQATVERNHILSNAAQGWAAGGLLVFSGANATISANEILSNTALNGVGGGIRVIDEGTQAKIDMNVIKENRARSGGGANVSWHSEVTVRDNIIASNMATRWNGAGLQIENFVTATILRNQLFDNSMSGNGTVGIEISGDVTATVDSNFIHSNGESHACVAISDNTTPIIFTNNVIAQNQCLGLFIGDIADNISIINNTFVDNRSSGITVWGPVASASLIRNNIVMGSNVGIESGGGASIAAADHNDSYNNKYNYINTPAGEGNISQDPLFVDPANGDYRLRLGSPSIDSGTAVDAPGHDLLGNARPQGGGVDMGAYESPPTNVYLPLVGYHLPPPIPFPQLVNGTFDLADESGWRQNTNSPSTTGHDLIVSDDEVDEISAHSAPNLAWLGGTSGVIDDLFQQIGLPIQYPNLQLSYRYWIRSEEPENRCEEDLFRLRIFTIDTGQYHTLNRMPLCKSTQTDGWQPIVIPIGEFAGQEVRIHFIAALDDENISNFFVDDVKICDGSGQHPCD